MHTDNGETHAQMREIVPDNISCCSLLLLITTRIYICFVYFLYICFQSLQQNSVSLLALVCGIQLWSRICAVHTKINSSSGLGREFETIVQRAVTKCLSTQHMHSTAYACTDRSKRHTHTQNGLYSCGYLRLPPFGMFLMFYIFLLLLFFSSCTDAR